MEQRSSDWVAEARAALTASWRERLGTLPALRRRELIALTVLVIAIVAGSGVAFLRALPDAPDRRVEPSSAQGPASPDVSASPSVVVYVAGAVRSPGVYELPAGARVVDGLKRAGGPASDADLDALNLAAPLTDGSKLFVPRRGEAPPTGGTGGGSEGASGGKVNINTATAAELDAGVPGVGPVLAQRIVDYRTQHGPFRSINDLLKVEGIGQKKFDSLKDSVTV